MAKQSKKFELTHAVWMNSVEQLAVGTAVTFPNDEPTGIFIGRVRELTSGGEAIEVATPKTPGTDGSELMPAETSSEAEVAAAPVPAPPAAKK